jgi:hypothetical protein
MAMTTSRSEQFFFEHAGYCFDPKKETAEQGRARCAKQLADAERLASEYGWTFEWEDDWSVGSHQRYYGEGSAYEDREPHTCESCVLRDENQKVLASLGCIDDANSEYRRVVEAELALEGLEEFRRYGAAHNA